MSARRIVVLGLSLSSSWGNGHATTYRALLRGLAALGDEVTFLERDVSWYADHRDLPDPDFCNFYLYESQAELEREHLARIAGADAVIVGSYVPDGVAVLDLVLRAARGVRAFYDIDTPVTMAALARGDADYIARRQIPCLDLYLSFSGGPVLRRVECEFGARRARALYCSVDPALYGPTGDARCWSLGYLGTYSADRQPALEELLIEPARRLPELRFVVAGPQYPATIDWPANVERIAHLPPTQHPAFYSRQTFTLNITRADMVACGWSPSVRLFEAAACGTPIISDRWPGLQHLLSEPEALTTVGTASDVVAILRYDDADRRRAIAYTARRIVLRHHTGRARAEELRRSLEDAEAGALVGS